MVLTALWTGFYLQLFLFDLSTSNVDHSQTKLKFITIAGCNSTCSITCNTLFYQNTKLKN